MERNWCEEVLVVLKVPPRNMRSLRAWELEVRVGGGGERKEEERYAENNR